MPTTAKQFTVLDKLEESSRKPLRVAMVAYSFYESDNRVRRYAEALAGRGDIVESISLRQEGQPAEGLLKNVRVLRIQRRNRDEGSPFSHLRKLLLFLLRSAWLLTIRHLRNPYDVIHVHSVPDFQVFATLIPRLLRARIVLDIHDIVPEFYASKFKVSRNSLVFRLLLIAEKASISYCHHVIIANHLWWEKLTKRSVAPEKCTAIINYPDSSIFYVRPRVNGQDGEFLLLYPGTLNWHQGLDLLVNAMTLLRESRPQARLEIIGDGPDREKLKQLIRDQHLEDRVRLSGTVPLEEVATRMASADLGVVPKRKDGFGNEAFSTKIMEFMAMGVAVLAANTRVDQYYFNERVLQFFESGDVEDLAAKIAELISNSQHRRKLRTEALAFIEENKWDERKVDYFNLVDQLVARKI